MYEVDVRDRTEINILSHLLIFLMVLFVQQRDLLQEKMLTILKKILEQKYLYLLLIYYVLLHLI